MQCKTNESKFKRSFNCDIGLRRRREVKKSQKWYTYLLELAWFSYDNSGACCDAIMSCSTLAQDYRNVVHLPAHVMTSPCLWHFVRPSQCLQDSKRYPFLCGKIAINLFFGRFSGALQIIAAIVIQGLIWNLNNCLASIKLIYKLIITFKVCCYSN
jgi:hypothetical protein